MRKIVLLFLILSVILLVAPAVSQSIPAADFAIREVFVQCNANHWHGSKVAPIKGTEDKIELECNQFWEALYNTYRPSPFFLLSPGQMAGPVPYSIWRPAIEDALQITPEPK